MFTSSAIVSAYYAENYIETRLINLLKQGCEIVVICQAGSAEEEVSKQYGVKTVITPDVPTIYRAWNLGVAVAKGKYLTSANTDDLLYDGALCEMVNELERTGAGICHSRIDVKTKGKIEAWDRPSGDYAKLRRWCFVGPMPVWRKSLHDKYGLFDESFMVAGDWEFWLRCTKKGERICFVNKSLGLYLSRPDSLEHRNKEAHYAERKRIKAMYG